MPRGNPNLKDLHHKPQQKICEECQEPFTSASNNQKFCSKQCTNHNHYEKYKWQYRERHLAWQKKHRKEWRVYVREYRQLKANRRGLQWLSKHIKDFYGYPDRKLPGNELAWLFYKMLRESIKKKEKEKENKPRRGEKK